MLASRGADGGAGGCWGGSRGGSCSGDKILGGGLLAGQGRRAATDAGGDLSQGSWADSVQQDDSETSAEL